jgi:hypothetical protein
MMTPLPNSGPKSSPYRIEYRHTRVRDGILLEQFNKLVADGFFREALELQKKDNAALLHLVHSDDLRYVCHFARFFSVFFQGFAV